MTNVLNYGLKICFISLAALIMPMLTPLCTKVKLSDQYFHMKTQCIYRPKSEKISLMEQEKSNAISSKGKMSNWNA